MKVNYQKDIEYSELNSMRASDTVRVDELNEQVNEQHHEILKLREKERTNERENKKKIKEELEQLNTEQMDEKEALKKDYE